MNSIKARIMPMMPPFLVDDTVYNTLADTPSLDRETPSPLRAFVLDAMLCSPLTELPS